MKEGLRSSARSLKDISLSDSAQSSDFIGSFNYKMSSIERARIQQDFENELIDTLDKSKAFELHGTRTSRLCVCVALYWSLILTLLLDSPTAHACS